MNAATAPPDEGADIYETGWRPLAGEVLSAPQIYDGMELNASIYTDGWEPHGRDADEVKKREQSPRPDVVQQILAENFDALAKLDAVAYDLCRETVAGDLGIRVSTLDAEVTKRRAAAEKQATSEKPKAADAPAENQQGAAVLFHEPKPWHEPVDGAETLSAVSAVLVNYLHLPDGAADAVALWVTVAHCFNAFQHSPRLNVTAATRGCGKTLLLDVISTLLPRALRIENLTPAVLFRIIAKERPALLVDECDRHLKENYELVGLLNAGFTKGGLVPRCEGDKNEVRLFQVFAPVALSGIGELPGTLHDRSIVIRMERAKPDEIHNRFDSRHIECETELKQKLMRWTADHKTQIESTDPVMMQAFNRTADVWRPMFAVAVVAGGDWPKRCAIAFAKIQRPDADSEPVAVQCLQDVASVMDEVGAEIMATHELVEKLVLLDERPWATWNHGKTISPRQLAKLLRGFGVVPTTHREGIGTFKGYRRASLDDALARYALTPPVLSVTPSQPNNGAASGDFLSVTSFSSVTDRTGHKANNGAACDVVTDKTPPLDPPPEDEAQIEAEAERWAIQHEGDDL